ncbi:hypothetical protein [Corynebacterium aquilae]|uniref:Uncharacterized protein n=1 Tax=Corynebacterium aquilae DSM 44791 TaxID=1431546 RepID=A0A1L7CF51_9CORY|nr:hypothetical protein [Corynebacterium aquilae]APT84403.1 hypothetical protein CAQU_04195 [Corynebacterium aquilae DSM 44791]
MSDPTPSPARFTIMADLYQLEDDPVGSSYSTSNDALPNLRHVGIGDLLTALKKGPVDLHIENLEPTPSRKIDHAAIRREELRRQTKANLQRARKEAVFEQPLFTTEQALNIIDRIERGEEIDMAAHGLPVACDHSELTPDSVHYPCWSYPGAHDHRRNWNARSFGMNVQILGCFKELLVVRAGEARTLLWHHDATALTHIVEAAENGLPMVYNSTAGMLHLETPNDRWLPDTVRVQDLKQTTPIPCPTHFNYHGAREEALHLEPHRMGPLPFGRHHPLSLDPRFYVEFKACDAQLHQRYMSGTLGRIPLSEADICPEDFRQIAVPSPVRQSLTDER